jgi:hypothetical protein
MADMLAVSTFQLGHPMALVVLMEAYDPHDRSGGIGVIRGRGSRQ